MDDKKIDDILKNMPAPESDSNAKKRAANLATAAFEEHQRKKEKKFQGFSFLGRLIGIDNQNERKKTMKNKNPKRLFIGSALAIGCACLLALPVAFDHFDSSSHTGKHVNETHLSKIAPVKPAQEEMVMAEVDTRALPPMRAKNKASADFARIASAPMARMELSAKPMVHDLTPSSYQEDGRDQFESVETNPIKLVSKDPVSTFSSDVDTSSYSFVRRQLNSGNLPQKDAIRVEEMINYFDYTYPVPETKEHPFKPTIAITDSPWNDGKKLMHIGIKGYDVETRPKSNLVFLLDTSGSMNASDKLPLLKNSLKLMLDSMNEDDMISIVAYAGSAGAVLEPTQAKEKSKIIAALENLRAGGSTAGAAGITLAYQLAEQNFKDDAVNRVILATDGDFNVGITNREELKDFVERKREKGIFLSVFGFGQGNYNDHLMQTLAQNGNGVAAYIDTLNEARKILVEEATSTLFPIAKDVKFQVEFNPNKVAEYRLVGYETRALKREDFNNDKVDAGDIGAGHTVTAIYEITPTDSETRSIDPLRYGEQTKDTSSISKSDEYGFLKIRYKNPKEDTSRLIEAPITSVNETLDDSLKQDTDWAIAVASFGQLLKGSQYINNFDYDDVIALANSAKGMDEFGYRSEFVTLVRLAKTQQ